MNLLVTGAWQQAAKFISQIEAMGNKTIFMQHEKDDLPCNAEWIEGIICNGLFLNHSINTFPNLRYIQLTSAGYDRVPMDYIKKHKIKIYNARGVYSIPMAEFVIAEVLNRYKHLNDFSLQQEKHEWKKHRDLLELSGKIVVIVGCGSVGTECAKRFKAFNCTVLGVDVLPRKDENYDIIKPVTDLDGLLNKADILLLTIPLTEETKGLINQNRIFKLKKDTILINIARGAVIDSSALEAWNGTAILDVFEDEPLNESSLLWDKNNWVITPHNSFVGDGNNKRLSNLIMKNLEGFDHE